MDDESQTATYPKTTQNSVNRYRHLSNYDAATIHSIVNSVPVAHVSFVDPDTQTPVVLPMMARIGQFPGGDDDGGGGTMACYLHGSATAPATKVLGLVLTLTPYSHTYAYRSAILHGRAAALDASPPSRAELLWALRLLTDGALPARWDHCRTPPDETELRATRVLKVRIDSASAKLGGQEGAEQAKDLEDERSRRATWTGVVPLFEVLGVPQAAPTNRAGPVPSYLREYVAKHNSEELARNHPEVSLWGTVSGLFLGVLAWVFGR
ncbi:flavin-nucleotide-binding protein [Apiospora rasikravindrae]|uniref:Flavin-nucleotide-binding protein n=1 Tax=Apiospora rasikravindrae TaxID=990691 RepID=A0ABR1RX05_9PEZI